MHNVSQWLEALVAQDILFTESFVEDWNLVGMSVVFLAPCLTVQQKKSCQWPVWRIWKPDDQLKWLFPTIATDRDIVPRESDRSLSQDSPIGDEMIPLPWWRNEGWKRTVLETFWTWDDEDKIKIWWYLRE